MDDPRKATLSVTIIIDFWAISHAKSGRKAAGALDAMVMKHWRHAASAQRPILDTIVG